MASKVPQAKGVARAAGQTRPMRGARPPVSRRIPFEKFNAGSEDWFAQKKFALTSSEVFGRSGQSRDKLR
jgi:hypothetical protein